MSRTGRFTARSVQRMASQVSLRDPADGFIPISEYPTLELSRPRRALRAGLLAAAVLLALAGAAALLSPARERVAAPYCNRGSASCR